ncbi:MAG: hypothetical protein HQ526_09390 [Actinobacteria bacterium]|nr:hypothetical protein [Actinomycetota bacterium]
MWSSSRSVSICLGAVFVAGSLAACSSSGGTASDGASTSSAPTFANANNVNIEGVWTSSDRRFLTIDGVRGEGTETITITDLKQSLFDVSRDLEVTKEASGNLGTGTATTRAILDGVGAINPDGTITILKKGDQGRITGWLVDNNTIEAVYSEGGTIPAQPNEPVVARYQLTRQTASPSASTS